MAKITKADVIRTVVKCAEQYKTHLLNRSLLFILMDKHKNTYSLEVSFNSSNFLHLTGVKIREVVNSKEETEHDALPVRSAKVLSANQFFDRCLEHKLKEDDFELAEDGTTELKLTVLPMMLVPNLKANMVGQYNNSQLKLYTEKLVGSEKACMGFRRDSKTGWLIPDTILKEDIRKKTNGTLRIIATYRKWKEDSLYSEMVYCAKKVDWEKIRYPQEYEYLAVPVNSSPQTQSKEILSEVEIMGKTDERYSEEEKRLIEAYSSSALVFIKQMNMSLSDALIQVQVPQNIMEAVRNKIDNDTITIK